MESINNRHPGPGAGVQSYTYSPVIPEFSIRLSVIPEFSIGSSVIPELRSKFWNPTSFLTRIAQQLLESSQHSNLKLELNRVTRTTN
jgi:hypothetical protein